MAVNQKAVKVLNKILDAGFTEEKAIAAMTMDDILYAGHHGGGYFTHQRPAKRASRQIRSFLFLAEVRRGQGE